MTFVTPNCIACGTSMKLLWARACDDRYGYPGYFDVYQCPNCLQAVTHPLLKDSELSGLYGDYYPRKAIDIPGLVSQAASPDSPGIRRYRRWSGTDNQGQYLAKPGMTVLDYGCGAGASLLEMREMGVEAFGIEADPNVQQVVDALGLRIFIGSIDDAPYQDHQFDMIVLNQVIEHIPEPGKLLGKLCRLLKPGGRMVLAFPNVNSIYARLFKRRWINWHLPYHLHHFNAKSMELFLSGHGWHVVSTRTITPNLWTILQFKTVTERPRMGIPSGFWTGGDATPDGPTSNQDGIAGILLNKKLRRWVSSMETKRLPNPLAVVNRVIDRCHQGDSLLMEIVAVGRKS